MLISLRKKDEYLNSGVSSREKFFDYELGTLECSLRFETEVVDVVVNYTDRETP